MNKVYVAGISGAGKTTLANYLESKGYSTVSVDEYPGLCVWYDKESGQRVDHGAELNQTFIQQHRWLCDVDALKRAVVVGKDVPQRGYGLGSLRTSYQVTTQVLQYTESLR